MVKDRGIKQEIEIDVTHTSSKRLNFVVLIEARSSSDLFLLPIHNSLIIGNMVINIYIKIAKQQKTLNLRNIVSQLLIFEVGNISHTKALMIPGRVKFSSEPANM